MTKKEMNSYLKRSDIIIEGNIATWNISIDGSIAGLYRGVFKFKCFLTPSEKLACGREYRNLLGPNASLAFKKEDDLAFTLAQLRYRVVVAPPFWNSAIGIDGQTGDIPDENVLDAVLEAAMAAEIKYMAQIQKSKEELIKKTKETAEKILTEQNPEEVEDEQQ